MKSSFRPHCEQMRSLSNGTALPLWQKMKRMSAKRDSAPENIRLMMQRLVSCVYSSKAVGTQGIRLLQQAGPSG